MQSLDKIWTTVDTRYASDRPDRIFLVLEQLLTPSYSITQKQGTSHECEIQFSASSRLPSVAEASIFSDYKVERAQAGFGFEVTSEQSNIMYAIFLDVYNLPLSRGIPIGFPKLARLVDKIGYILLSVHKLTS
jgi:hypothetical protein